MLWLDFEDDTGLIVHLGEAAKIAFPEQVPPGAIPVYLADGYDTILEE